jgi:hypothetical protein
MVDFTVVFNLTPNLIGDDARYSHLDLLAGNMRPLAQRYSVSNRFRYRVQISGSIPYFSSTKGINESDIKLHDSLPLTASLSEKKPPVKAALG